MARRPRSSSHAQGRATVPESRPRTEGRRASDGSDVLEPARTRVAHGRDPLRGGRVARTRRVVAARTGPFTTAGHVGADPARADDLRGSGGTRAGAVGARVVSAGRLGAGRRHRYEEG